MTKQKAMVYHHTHWDAEWYFTEQASQVQFVFHMKELFLALEKGWIDTYHLDGKTSEMEDYFRYCPEDKPCFEHYVKEGRILLGPLYEQLSAFIAPGESVIKNLQIGTNQAEELGGCCKVAYIPDSFGQIKDYPKIFNLMEIYDFVFRRGMGDVHQLKNDFIWKNADGSRVLTSVLQAGYSFAGLAFMQGRLIKNAGLNLDKKSIINQMKLCGQESALKQTFLLPAGKDNCPVMYHFKDLLKQYNEESHEFEFEETTLPQYMEQLRNGDIEFQEYEGEFYTTQYHRVHKSIFSARADIKIIQDKTERMLIYEIQPLMSMLDGVGIGYEHGLIEDIWKILIRSQTHSEATNSDEVNEQILARAKRAFQYAESLKVYLTRKIAVSVREEPGCYPLVIFNTLPMKRNMDLVLTVYTKEKEFQILRRETVQEYGIIRQKKVYGGWKRKHRDLLDVGRDYYETQISLCLEQVSGCSYESLQIRDGKTSTGVVYSNQNQTYIENECYRIEFFGGNISLRDKKRNQFIENAFMFENSGDQGDTFDYDYPDQDQVLYHSFEDAVVVDSCETPVFSQITLEGSFSIPSDLRKRKAGVGDEAQPYQITLQLYKNSPVITVKGRIKNTAKNHRMRFILKTKVPSEVSIAGTQFGTVCRRTKPEELEIWKEEGWLEEPLPIEPLLNHVTLKGKEHSYTVFTRSTKEYQVIGEDCSHLALTIYRAVGHFGLPDLNRRPGRASGIPECIMECPLSQMQGKEIEFEYGVALYPEYSEEKVARDYVTYAAQAVYFQDQEFDRVFTPMKYFEVNPLTNAIPAEYCLIEMEGEAVFSTCEKSKKDSAVLFRIFNPQNKTIDGGILKIHKNYRRIQRVNLREEVLSEGNEQIGNMKPGEIQTYKIFWE